MSLLRQIPMMSIPTKSTDDIDMIAPLRHFIKSNYGSPADYSEEYASIQRLRQDARCASKDDAGRDQLYRYYGQLELLELRFPIDEDHVQIAFHWYDAFTETGISQYSLAYEKACVLFNIAATLSYIASNQTRSDLEGMKKAYHCLQVAVGLLNFINDNFLHAPSSDLSRESIKALSTIMLAQAQEVFTEKQLRDQGKSSLIAKLAAETASLYHISNECLSELAIAGNVDIVWAAYSEMKEKYFSSLAQYHLACFDKEKERHGLAVSRLQIACILAKDASTLAKSNSSVFSRYPWLSNEPGLSLVENFQMNSNLLSDKLESARRENDMIYHEAVTKESVLPPTERLASAKPMALTNLYPEKDVARIIGPDIFRKLVPLATHESASRYSEEIAKLLRAEQERCDIADSELSAALDHLGLPGALHNIRLGDDRVARELTSVPRHIEDLLQTAQLLAERHPIEITLKKVMELKNKIAGTLTRLGGQLDEEEQQSESMRNRYREQWAQKPAGSLTIEFRTDLQNLSDSLAVAKKSDSLMESEYQSALPDIHDLLVSNSNLFAIMFRDLAPIRRHLDENMSLLDLDETCNIDVVVLADQVDDSIRKLHLVRKERRQTLLDLKERARDDDISDILIFNVKTPDREQKVFTKELEKFKSHQIRIQATLSRQEQLLGETKSVFDYILNDKDSQAKQKAWENMRRARSAKIASIERAAVTHRTICVGFTKAIKFYEELDGLTQSLSDQIRDYLRSRQAEGRHVLERLGLGK